MCRNDVLGEVILADLVSPLSIRLHSLVDILIFNPPYVPSELDELNHRDLRAAWAGGADGVQVCTHQSINNVYSTSPHQVINRFLPLVNQIISPSGMLFLVLIEANLPDRICHRMGEFGFLSEVGLLMSFFCETSEWRGFQTVAQKRVAGEKLRIVKFFRSFQNTHPP